MRVKCLAQEHNTMTPARARTRTARFGDELTNHEATAPPTGVIRSLFLLFFFSALEHSESSCQRQQGKQ